MIVVIPARLASTRLPNKLLLPIAGKPLLQHTWQQAQHSGATQVIVATDSEQIAAVCKDFGAEVCLTDIQHQSGTDRIAEVAARYQFDDAEIVVNLQGDEPLMPTAYLAQVAQHLQEDQAAEMATLATPLAQAEYNNPNVVKVVMNKHQHALYFSRSMLPYLRQTPENFVCYRHLGLYAYRAGFLRTYATLAPAALEQAESLEQLRVLWHGYCIHVGTVEAMPGSGVDTREDFEAVKTIIENTHDL